MTVVRHRLIVICYFVCWATVYPVRYRPQESSQGIWIEVLIYVMSQVTVISSVVDLIVVAARVQKLCLEAGLVLHAVRQENQSAIRLAPR